MSLSFGTVRDCSLEVNDISSAIRAARQHKEQIDGQTDRQTDRQTDGHKAGTDFDVLLSMSVH